MGLQQTVTFAEGKSPSWALVCDLLARERFVVQVRMIDGELAFPDETPADGWTELRLGAVHGMITLRREADQIHFIVWGNAESALMHDRDLLLWAFAEVGDGRISTLEGDLTAADFRQVMEKV